MREYMIYTVNDTEPIIVKTEEDLVRKFKDALYFDDGFLQIDHIKEVIGGTFNYKVALNLDNIVSITTKEKID